MSSTPSVTERHGHQWTAQLFGGLQLRNGSHHLDHWPPSALTKLLARLLLDPTPQPRDELAQWLWPTIRPRKGRGSDDARALRRTRLRNLLSRLDRLLDVDGLPPGGALLRGSGLQLNPAAFSTETRHLEALLLQGRLDEATVVLGRGLLPELQDPWLDTQRERWQGLLARARLGLDDPVPTPTPDISRPAGRFFGRQRELALLQVLLSTERLVAITGPGGCGKSRLAHQALVDLSRYGTLAFVALAAHEGSERLLDHVRDTLQIQPGAQPALKQIVTRLSGQPALLVLDNFEAFADPAGEAALLTLLDALPRLQLLLTTTRALHTPRCRTLRLDPLPLPRHDDDLRSAADEPAVALFVERAQAVRPGFKLTARNRAVVIEVCRATDGLPLAIELAASRVRQVPPGAMAQALQRSHQLLARVDPAARRQPRHASLQAVLDWGFGLLDAAQQRALMQLSCLRSAFTAEQAASVLGRRVARPVLDTLVRESQLRLQADAAGGWRWRLPAALREHAAERSPKRLLLAAARRHTACYARLALGPAAQAGWLDLDDVPDMVAAAAFAWRDGQPAPAASIALALARHAAARGTLPEALDFLQQVGQAMDPAVPGHAELRGLLPHLFVDAGRVEAAQSLAETALAQAGGQPLLRAQALLTLTQARWRAERDAGAAWAPTLECLRLARRTRTRALQARVLAFAGALKLQLGRGPLKALATFRSAGRRYGESDDPRDAVRVVPGITACHLVAGRFELAAEQAAAAERLAIATGDINTQLLLCNRQGEALGELGQWAEALAVNQRQVQVARQHGMAYHLAYGLWNQCLLLAKLRQPARAALLMGFSQRYWESQFEALNEDDLRYVRRVRRMVIAQTSAAEWRRHSERGASLDDAEAMRLGSG